MSEAQKKFEGLLSRYFERYLEENPTFATAYAGLREGEGKLEAWSHQFLRRQENERQKTLHALDQISPRDLTSEQHLDRLALRAHLLRESEDFERGRHTLEPDGPSHLLNILLHELMRGDDEPA